MQYSQQINTPFAKMMRLQEFQQRRFDLGEIRVGRFESVEFGASGRDIATDIPRFTVTILDAASRAPR